MILSKIRHDVNKYVMMSMFVMTSKSTSWNQQVHYDVKSHEVKVMSWRQKSMLSCQKVCRVFQSYVRTSTVRHDVKKYVIMSKSMSCVSKLRHDIKSMSWYQKVQLHYNVKGTSKSTLWRQKWRQGYIKTSKYVMTSKLHYDVKKVT